ncbi:MAG TPA: ORF6N domain-containing protein [Sulfuricurvum sp.]|nr:MAG: DNA-binding protein [Campylobacterales bacterium 16-40-21]OZA02349.1 MAG: DNA-binding protein [Sulfuricurvum sp. 17-40-25]HQS67237.1 ORF6N domain-containing protein [Sulfuricurvum sp.]HQT36016.1 ORF6N domain-containing protein [Sulfuricurvum sp.]
MNEISASIDDSIKNKIYTIRELQVMLDRDLAELYGVETKVFNQAVKRNEDRFPSDFRFQLTAIEKNELVTNCDRLNSLKHSTVNPYVFTEQGVSMLSAVLKSTIAVDISVKIIRIFVQMRQFLSANNELFQKIEQIEKRQITYELKSDEKFEKIFRAIEDKSIKPKQGIFYDGQVYDAYVFVSDLIKSAKESIVLIDNYIDDTVFTLLSKRDSKLKVTIYTKNITKQLELDVQKNNAQYPNIELKKFDSSHDRFLIIDANEVYHIGASLKDLGKKWFAFSKFDMGALGILERLNEK